MAANDWSFGATGDFDRLRRQMDDIFGRFAASAGLGGSFPAVNAYEEDEGFTVALQAPGISKENLTLEVRENVLTIVGKRECNYPDGAVALRQEMSCGDFRRTLRLPSKVKNDAAEARFQDGILMIKVPKTEDAKPKHIAINA